MLFYKASHRSTLQRHRHRHARSDHDNQVEHEGFRHEGAGPRPDDDHLLSQIAQAAQAEADTHTPAVQPAPPADQRLSTFESELLAAWAET